jgi:Mg/Co/Ni transporter MgtE
MLIGYIAGALGKRSTSYRRMITAGVVAGIMGALFVVFVGQYSPILGGISASGVLLAFLPRVLAGVIVPFIARAFLRHGALQGKHT